MIDEDGVENCADDAGVSARNDADAGSETHVNGDEKAPLLDEFLEVREAVIAQTGANVGRRVDASEIGREVGILPGHGVVPHWNSVDDVLR